MSNSTVAAVLAKDLAALGARRCFGLLGTANFKISHALVEAGVELTDRRPRAAATPARGAYKPTDIVARDRLEADERETAHDEHLSAVAEALGGRGFPYLTLHNGSARP